MIAILNMSPMQQVKKIVNDSLQRTDTQNNIYKLMI